MVNVDRNDGKYIYFIIVFFFFRAEQTNMLFMTLLWFMENINENWFACISIMLSLYEHCRLFVESKNDASLRKRMNRMIEWEVFRLFCPLKIMGKKLMRNMWFYELMWHILILREQLSCINRRSSRDHLLLQLNHVKMWISAKHHQYSKSQIPKNSAIRNAHLFFF